MQRTVLVGFLAAASAAWAPRGRASDLPAVALIQPAGTTDGAAPAPDKPAPGAEERPVPPSQRLGFRAAMVRTRLPVNPIVVIVPDGPSYAAAIERWRYDDGVRYPVLIDDGSWASRRAIARFVRAFRPKSVYRWSTPEQSSLPRDPDALVARLSGIAARPWLAETGDFAALQARWSALKFVPPGVVVAQTDDRAWPAALALAAGRGQPIIWLAGSPGGRPDGYMSAREAAALARTIESATDALGYAWKGLGDELDAITLCVNCATKVYLGDKDPRAMLSLTDWLGRAAASPEDPPEKGPGLARWAWAGQVLGNEWQSAYGAMCALFLATDAAWLFDGYDPAPPWSDFDATEAAAALEKAGIRSVVDDDGGRSIAAWRRRTARGIDAGLICVNTSGNQDFFDLKPGQARPCDVPILRRPSIVHFVHSWSAAAPSDPGTVAGRWLERGAYAYVGSVHEPYLQAFVPTPKFARRLVAGLPLGAAARLDAGEVWKVSVLGDPLVVLGKSGPIVEGKGIPDDAKNVEADLADAVKARDYARALVSLTHLGREDDAAKLIAAVMREDPDRLTPEAALEGLPALFFAGDATVLADAFRVALPLIQGQKGAKGTAGELIDAQDLLWHALWPSLSTLTRAQAEVLSRNLRAQTLVRDTSEAHVALSAAAGKDAAAELIRRAASQAANEAERRQVEQTGR